MKRLVRKCSDCGKPTHTDELALSLEQNTCGKCDIELDRADAERYAAKLKRAKQ